MPVIMLHGYSLTSALLLSASGCGLVKQEVAFAEVCITLHFSLSSSPLSYTDAAVSVFSAETFQ